MRSSLSSDGLKKGPWTPEEDLLLIKYIEAHGVGHWSTLPKNAGLKRCGKSCRLRWMNHLRPNVKHGQISPEEEDLIIRLHNLLGNRWALIAGRVPGRTDNEVKNYWNTYLSKKLALKRIEPKVHDRSHLGLVIKERLFCGDVNGERDMKIDCADHQSSGSSDSSTLIKDTHVSADSDDSQFIPPKDLTVESVQMFLNEGYSHVASDFPSSHSSTNYIHDFVPNSTATCNVTTPRPSTEWSKAYAASVLGKDNQAIVNSNLTKSVYSADEPCNKGNIVYDQINSDGLILNETTGQCVQPVSGSGPNLDSFWDSPFVSSRNNYNNWFELMNIPYVGTYELGEFINDYDFVLSVE